MTEKDNPWGNANIRVAIQAQDGRVMGHHFHYPEGMTKDAARALVAEAVGLLRSTADQQAAGSVEAVRAALRKAYNLGQTYWQQADSEYRSENKKSDATAAKFLKLIDDTVAQIAALDSRAQPVAAGELPPLPHRAKDDHGVWYFTEAQMKSYGQQCADSRPAATPNDEQIERFTLYHDHGCSNMMGTDDGEYVLYTDHIEALRRADSRPAGGVVDVCSEMRALCSACGGTGEVHRPDGEYIGECGTCGGYGDSFDPPAATLAAPAAQAAPEWTDADQREQDYFDRWPDQASAAQPGASIDTPEFARLLLAWHEARLDNSNGTDVSAQANAIIRYVEAYVRHAIDAQRPVAAAVPDVVREALEATFEQRPGFLIKVSAAIRAIAAAPTTKEG